jgi:hypothetical protein
MQRETGPFEIGEARRKIDMSRKSGCGGLGLAMVLCMTMIWSACSTDWIGEAEQIVAALIPAASNIVALVAALGGKNVSATDLQTIQSAGTQAGADLELIQSLITAYQKADATAKPGILNQIESAIAAVQGNLSGMLQGLHIKDAATQTKITAVVGLVLAEVQSLAAIVPVVTRVPVVGAKEVKTSALAANGVASRGRARAPLSANEFVQSYNSTLIARTGNAELDRVTARLRIHLHGKVERVASGGVLK